MKYIRTINLAHQCMGVSFKKRAPKCIKAIKAVAQRITKVDDVKIGEEINAYVWSNGIRNVPRKIRVSIEVKEDDNKQHVVVNFVDVDSFKGLRNESE